MVYELFRKPGLTPHPDPLVFKGGTCLAKVYAGLYRLSEDLDFAIPVPFDLSRSERGRRVERVREALIGLKKAFPLFLVIKPLKGANRSTQYLATLGYNSLLSQQEETIKIEVSLREPLLMPAVNGEVHTLVRNPVTNHALLSPITLRCIAKPEALAEKFRAALSRRDPKVCYAGVKKRICRR